MRPERFREVIAYFWSATRGANLFILTNQMRCGLKNRTEVEQAKIISILISEKKMLQEKNKLSFYYIIMF